MGTPAYTSAAIQDLEDIVAFIARDKPIAAIEWIEKVEAKCLLIASSPETGEPMPQFGAGIRASSVGRSVIFHRSTDNRLELLRVLTGNRDITGLS